MTTDKITVLVTGAAGTIGKEVIRQLLEKTDQYRIRAFDVKSGPNMRNLDKYQSKIEVVWGDITNPQDLLNPTRGVDYCIHLAAIIPPMAQKKTKLTEQVNVFGTQNLLRNLEQHSPGCFIAFASSVSVYGDRLEVPYIRVGDALAPSIGDTYGLSKLQAEKLVQESRLDWTVFRLSAVFGVENHKISDTMFLMPLETPIEFITPRDAARAFTNGYENKTKLWGRVFNIGGGESCRVIYKDFLEDNFTLYGLGNLDFPENAFARHNSHCGYYADGDEAESFLHFRKDTYQTLLAETKKHVNFFRFMGSRMFGSFLKKRMLTQSKPFKVSKDKNSKEKQYFF